MPKVVQLNDSFLEPHPILSRIEKHLIGSFVFEKMQSENGARRNSKCRIQTGLER